MFFLFHRSSSRIDQRSSSLHGYLREIVSDSNWDEYVEEMKRDRIWADDLVVYAAAQHYNRQIILISSSEGERYVVRINPSSPRDPPEHLLLMYRSGLHYDPIFPTPPQQPHSGLRQLRRRPRSLDILNCFKHDLQNSTQSQK